MKIGEVVEARRDAGEPTLDHVLGCGLCRSLAVVGHPMLRGVAVQLLRARIRQAVHDGLAARSLRKEAERQVSDHPMVAR